MWIIEVIPIKKGFGKDGLSYFSSVSMEEGSIVKIPLRGKTVSGIVTACTPAAKAKAELKSSSFSLRKISSISAKYFFEDEWIAAAKKTANFFAYSLGSTIAALSPVSVLDNISKLSQKAKKDKVKSTSIKLKTEVLCIQSEDEERFGHYRAAIREEFARGHSVFFVLPTIEDVYVAEEELQKGIADYTFSFHSDLAFPEILKRSKAVSKVKHPVLVVVTPQWLFLKREDLGTVILDSENSSGWKTLGRPYLDMRKFAEFFAREKGVRFILGADILRVETLHRYKQEEIFAFESVKFRFSSLAESALISMVGKDVEKQKKFRTTSPELMAMVSAAKDEKKNIFIYATRKGLSPITVCSDCGENVVCHNCASPMVLYKRASVNVFRCHQCSSERSAKEICKNCASWRLQPLGVGIENIIDEIETSFPEVNILQISRDVATQSRASQIADKFYKTPGTILIGTEMALHYLRQGQVDFTAVASIDSLFSVPDFRIREKIFHIVARVRNLAREASIVQVRKAERNTLELALSGNVLDFYKMEIDDREILQYPPFSVFIKITVRGTKITVEKEAHFLEEYFRKWQPTIFDSRSERRDSQAALNCVLKVPKTDYPDPDLSSRLLSLPPQFEIKVDPDNLL